MKKLAKIIFPPVAHPFCRGLAALILGILIIKVTVQAAVKITPAKRAKILAANPLSLLDFLSARMTNPHKLIIHPNEEGTKFRGHP